MRYTTDRCGNTMTDSGLGFHQGALGQVSLQNRPVLQNRASPPPPPGTQIPQKIRLMTKYLVAAITGYEDTRPLVMVIGRSGIRRILQLQANLWNAIRRGEPAAARAAIIGDMVALLSAAKRPEPTPRPFTLFSPTGR